MLLGPNSFLRALAVGAIASLAAAAPVSVVDSSAARRDASDTYTIGVRTLVLSANNGESGLVPQMLESFGHPFDLVEVGNVTDPKLKLKDSDGNPKYGSIVFSDAKLYNGEGSSLSEKEWDKLKEYRSRYNVRAVSMASSTWDPIGLRPCEEYGADGSSATADLSFDASSPFLQAYAGSVNTDAIIRTGNLKHYLTAYYWWYPSEVDPEARQDVDIFMYLNSTEFTDGDADRKFPAGLVYTGDGLETMHFMINANEFGHHGALLANIWFPWLTRGLFIGQRRYLLSAQVDDLFLRTGQYIKDNQRGSWEDAVRVTGQDLENHKIWQDELNANLPASSRVVIEHAYNGFGFNQDADDDLAEASLRLREDFFWVSHTWTHMDLTCIDSDCATNGPTSYADAFEDIDKNRVFANDTLFASKYYADGSEAGEMSKEERNDWPTYSNTSIVTPRISGLLNPDAVKALLDDGYLYAVGDNSRPELLPPNGYSMTNSTKDSKGREVTLIPRFSTNIYFDVSTPENNAQEYNDFYGPNCYGHDQDTLGGEEGYMCTRDSFKWEADLTMDDIFYIEAFNTVRNLLLGRADPYMFHQGNMRTYTNEEGKETSLLMSWIHAVTGKFTELLSVPMYTLKMQDLVQYYKDRMRRAECGLDGTISYVNGQPKELTLSAECGKVTAKVTRAAGVKVRYADDSTEELYGTDLTRNVVIRRNHPVTIPLRPEAHHSVAPHTTFSLPYPPMERPKADESASR